MRRFARIAGYVLGAIVVLLVVGYGAAFTISDRKLAEKYDVVVTTVAIPDDEASIAWGAHLVNAVTGCTDCHGPDLSGTVMSDDPVAVMSAPNLTAGRGGIGGDLTTQDWIRAIRHGVRSDGSSLLIMPSYAYAHLSDTDLGAMIAYLRQIPAVDNELPRFRVRPLGRALLAAGAFDEEIVARKMPADARESRVERGLTREYGQYLANIGGCLACHRPDLKGGPAGPPDAPPASDISAEGLAGWGLDDFFRAMREGKRPDGSEISEYMPWPALGRMTDDELGAIWKFLTGEEVVFETSGTATADAE
jgi:mono/diheme cytochrome c family protein